MKCFFQYLIQIAALRTLDSLFYFRIFRQTSPTYLTGLILVHDIKDIRQDDILQSKRLIRAFKDLFIIIFKESVRSDLKGIFIKERIMAKDKLMLQQKKKKAAKEKAPSRKKTTIIHKSEKPTKVLIELLGEIERTIRELTVLMAESPLNTHRGVRGLPKLTTKQIEIKKQIEAAQRRYNAVLKLLMSSK